MAAAACFFVVGSIINSDSVRFMVLGWTYDMVQIFAILCFVIGLTIMYLLLRRRSPVGLLGLALVFLSFLASAMPTTYLAYRIILWAYGGVGSDHPPFAGTFVVTSVWIETLLLAGGVFLLGVAAFGTRILGRWRILPFVVSLLNLPIFWILALLLDWTRLPWTGLGTLAVLRVLDYIGHRIVG